jgi:hypothetical protein
MKTRTKVLIAASCAALVGSLTVAWPSVAECREPGWPAGACGPMALQAPPGPPFASGGPHGPARVVAAWRAASRAF